MIDLKAFNTLDEAVLAMSRMGHQLGPELAGIITRIAKGVRQDVSGRMAKSLGLAVEEIGDWKFDPARPGDLEALAVFYGKRIGLEKLSPNPSGIMEGKTSGGVSVTILGKKHQFKHAFMGTRRRHHPMVLESPKGRKMEKRFNRITGKTDRPERNHLYHLTLASAPGIADHNEGLMELVVTNADKKFIKRFDSLVDRLLEENG